MSEQEPPRFTPAQILEAGRRAASDGRADVARQFYHHLISNFPGSAEANVAGQGLEQLRLDFPPLLAEPGAPATSYSVWAGTAGGTPGQAYGEIPPGASTGLNGWHQPAVLAPPPPPAPISVHNSSSGPAPAPVSGLGYGDDHAFPGPLPEPIRDYRTGRLLARLTAWSGGAIFLMALALLPVAMVSPRTLASTPLLRSLDMGFSGALTMSVAGLGLVMLGQVVRAMLDHANAARDLAVIHRARATPSLQSPQGARRRRG